MLTKVILLYPGANLLELVERFFFTYSTWNWQLPLRISKSGQIEQQKSVTIYTPTYPEMSLTAKITESSQKTILDALIKGIFKCL
uniref:Poly(A) polymerase central domain-containing protein n=1 Tax=Meloidogyne enterolobii TaxID=390850 RepID=A0A6V7UD98_MELEN|nr:unnamed protein product [Meloidogyne enterolobii]